MNGASKPLLSIRACVALSVLAGLLGLVLMRLVPIGPSTQYTKDLVEWGRQADVIFRACGKHYQDPECLSRNPLPPRP